MEEIDLQERLPISRESLENFCRRYRIQRLALFGSVLRNDFRPDSDVDVLVTFAPGARVSFVTLGRMQQELNGLFWRNVDLVPQDGLKPIIRADILESAREIYAA